MKNKTSLFILLSFLIFSADLNAQGLYPTEGKAVVYFTRVTPIGALVSFEFFRNDQFIGVFKGKNYMRYEVDPGEHLFWASSENKEFVTADLKAGEVYLVIVDVKMGVAKARVGSSPITDKAGKLYNRAQKLINSKAPIVTSEEKIRETVAKLEAKDFIARKLGQYENDWKHRYNYPHISPIEFVSKKAY